jgi:hypothetical protein
MANVCAEKEVHPMNRMKALSAALYSAALSLWALPALALAQASQPGSSPAPMDRPAGATNGPASTNWLWIIAAIVVLAIVWWAVSSRRRGTTTRT